MNIWKWRTYCQTPWEVISQQRCFGGNFGTFAFDVYEGFQNMIATLAVAGDIAHAYTSVDYAILISCSGECRVN